MNNEREGWEFKRSTIETNPKDEIQNKGNKKNNYKHKDNERNYEYGQYKKHIKKNEYVDKGRINNENTVYKKNYKKKRENNYEINDRYSENIEEFEINNQIQQDERTKHKNYTQVQPNNAKKNYYNHNNTNHNQITNINNNTNSNLNNSNEQNQQKNINQFNYYQDNQINNLNYINNNTNNNNKNNNNNNNKNGLVKNYNQILTQQQYRKFNNTKQFNNKNKNNNNNLSMTTSMIQITSGNSLDNQMDQISNLMTENSTNTNLSMSLNSDNLSSKNQSYFTTNLPCAPISNHGNDMYINNINKPNPTSYFNGIPINNFLNYPMNPMEQRIFTYPAFTVNSINQNNNMIINNSENIKDSKKKNNLLGKNKGNRSNQGNKNIIPNNNNTTNLNFNSTINPGLFINPSQTVTHYKKKTNKKLGFKKLNSDKNIPLNNFSFIPQKNILNNNKTINQNIQKKEQIFPFNKLILKLKLPNGSESTDFVNINSLESDIHNIIQKYENNNYLNEILNESIYNKIIMSLELTNTIFSNNISKYERMKLDDLRKYYESLKDDDELSNYSIEDILEYNKYYDMINDIKIDKNDMTNFEIFNYTF